MSAKNTKTILLRSTILVGAAAFALPAFAQTAPTKVAAAADVTPVVDSEPVITVTGSLIKNPNLVRSAPVTVTTADEIELKQSNVAEDVLREIPGVVPSIGSAVNNGNGGASYVDLRGLGSNRNIVLLDGNRLVPANVVGRVDLNNIPLALVSRVEALTGAAVTTYGADAVTGVVNFITKQDFTGVDFSGNETINGKGDGNYYRTDLTIGGNFADDKGNAVLSIGYQHSDPVYQGDRGFSTNNVDSFSGAIGGSSTSVPSRFTGTRPIDPATGLPSTNPAVANNGQRYINPTTGLATIISNPFNFNPYNIFQTPFQRYNIYGQAKYDVSDNITFYTRGLFSKNTVNTIVAPSGVFSSSVVIPLSNPYLPAGLRNQFCALNVSTVAETYTPLFTPTACTAASTALSPTDPNYKTVTTTIRRRAVEVGPRISEFVSTVFDYRLGARGKLNDHLDWDVNGSYGQSENRQTLQNYTLTSRVRDALLSTNKTTCLSLNAGCVPINIFGPAGSIAPNQIPYLTAGSTTLNKSSLAQVKGTLSGDFGFEVPSAKDPISFAVGIEYRKYTASQASDLLSQTPGELGGAGGAAPTFSGGYDVREVFGELVAPLVQDRPFFDSLTLEAGIRYSDYKVNGGNSKYSTTTYKGGGSWAPGFGLKIRGNYSRAVRAPNINELFNPVTTGLTNLAVDPCSGAAPLTNANLRAVCIAQGAPAGTIGTIQDPAAGQANETGGGNINIRPEIADTYTGGIVFQPNFVHGLSLTVDYYKIIVNHAITQPTSNDVIAGCFNNLTAASALSIACTGIRRDPVAGSLDGDPATTFGLPFPETNLGRLKTDGIDLSVNYSRDIGFAKLGLSFLGNYTFHQQFQAVAFPDPRFPVLGVNRECVGYYSANCGFSGSLQPKFQWTQRTTLGFDTFDVSLLWRHLDGLKQEPADADPINGSGPAFGSFGKIPAYDYLDLSGRVSVTQNLVLTLTVTNLLDKNPPVVGSTIGNTSYNSGNTYPSTYDALGRRFAVGVRVRY